MVAGSSDAVVAECFATGAALARQVDGDGKKRLSDIVQIHGQPALPPWMQTPEVQYRVASGRSVDVTMLDQRPQVFPGMAVSAAIITGSARLASKLAAARVQEVVSAAFATLLLCKPMVGNPGGGSMLISSTVLWV